MFDHTLFHAHLVEIDIIVNVHKVYCCLLQLGAPCHVYCEWYVWNECVFTT